MTRAPAANDAVSPVPMTLEAPSAADRSSVVDPAPDEALNNPKLVIGLPDDHDPPACANVMAWALEVEPFAAEFQFAAVVATRAYPVPVTSVMVPASGSAMAVIRPTWAVMAPHVDLPVMWSRTAFSAMLLLVTACFLLLGDGQVGGVVDEFGVEGRPISAAADADDAVAFELVDGVLDVDDAQAAVGGVGVDAIHDG